MRNFSAHETAWLLELDGIELAPFWRRAVAIAVDGILILIALLAVITLGAYGYAKLLEQRGQPIHRISASLKGSTFDIESDNPAFNRHVDDEPVRIVTELLVPVVYFGTFPWLLHGRTPGKLLTRIRVVSTVHRQLSLWHAVERALGFQAHLGCARESAASATEAQTIASST